MIFLSAKQCSIQLLGTWVVPASGSEAFGVCSDSADSIRQVVVN